MADQIELPLRILDASGDPVSGAKIYFYEAGTSTPLTVYTTEALSVAHASPLVADSGGYPARAFYSGSVAARVRIYTADDVELFDIDPAITVGVGGAAADISFSAIPTNTATNVQDAIENLTTAPDFSSVTNAAAIRSALAVPGKAANETISGDWTYTGSPDYSGVANAATIRADLGTPGGLDFIATSGAISSAAAVDFTAFDSSKYDGYLVTLTNVTPATDGANLTILTSSDGGSTFDTTSGDYLFSNMYGGSSTSPTMSADAAATAIRIAADVGGAAGERGVSGFVKILGPHLTEDTNTVSQVAYQAATGAEFLVMSGAGQRNSSSAVNAVRFRFSAGNIASGEINLYGLRNSA